MKVALTIWEGRISPVFDSARRIAIFEIADGKFSPLGEEILPEISYPAKANRLIHLQIETLICGAISRPLACLVEALGIRLIPFIAGFVEEVLNAYLTDSLLKKQYRMPGCYKNIQCHQKQSQCICPQCIKKRRDRHEDMYSG